MGLETSSGRTRVRVSRTGAKALHAQGKAHQYNTERARAAAIKRWNKVRALRAAESIKENG